jgi:hypothetical protein
MDVFHEARRGRCQSGQGRSGEQVGAGKSRRRLWFVSPSSTTPVLNALLTFGGCLTESDKDGYQGESHLTRVLKEYVFSITISRDLQSDRGREKVSHCSRHVGSDVPRPDLVPSTILALHSQRTRPILLLWRRSSAPVLGNPRRWRRRPLPPPIIISIIASSCPSTTCACTVCSRFFPPCVTAPHSAALSYRSAAADLYD